ncbi:hypothetical protein LJY25_07580 [Hymenobacter sp. BT175]|uniref:hypothetical protein n=1 Tax=Hymenobacter translucens TaxID=2886507 RepID=UPI001D0E138B|nr:hypothetical protein [Hymenobacter translucens]MCC2546302.1 hypothetical protein [Hymenobacter translucens]
MDADTLEVLLPAGLVLVGFLVWRLVQKVKMAVEKQKWEQQTQVQPPVKTPPLPATSFEELLKQMQAQNREKAAPREPAMTVPDTAHTPGGRAMPHEAATRARSLEQGAKINSMEVPAVRKSAKKQQPAPVRQADTLPRASTQPPTKKYLPFEPAENQTPSSSATNHRIREQLQSPADLRAAFILSEILQRRF